MEHYIFQNNAVNIYENYFEDIEEVLVHEKCSNRTVNVYRDPSSTNPVNANGIFRLDCLQFVPLPATSDPPVLVSMWIKDGHFPLQFEFPGGFRK